MCGLTGFWGFSNHSNEVMTNVVRSMSNAMYHRGPDDMGSWSDAQASFAIGHRRLSILDLSAAGHQPMISKSGRFVIAFNGEIYNHLELRQELQRELELINSSNNEFNKSLDEVWSSNSDTETLLSGFEQWGIETTLSKSVGMFAIALWDIQERTLHLARDRFGEKPLYYGWTGSPSGRAFVFGSELKSLRAFPGFNNPVCREALAQYMRFMVVPAPRSIYQGIYKLEPGCLLSITRDVPLSAPELPMRPPETYENLKLSRWWSLAESVQAGVRQPITDEGEALERLEQLLTNSVRLQSLADVPLGAFLSGGVDSSSIVALMQRQSTLPVKTFTVRFEEAGFDESAHARAVAKHLGTDHSELPVTFTEAQAIIAKLPEMYDEPFADSSQIPTYLISKAARQHVTVALSGDAGDELFGGYNRYFWGPRIWSKLAWLPYSIRKSLAAAISAVPPIGWDALSSPANACLRGGGISRVGDKAHKLADRLRSVQNLDDLYFSLVSEWQDPAQVVRSENGSNVVEPVSLLKDPLPVFEMAGVANSPDRMMYQDTMMYLPDDILCKVDRASMAVSLETRVPFLDHRLVDLAWSLPLHMKMRGNTGKWALRQVLYKYVPQKLIERPKAGFAIPIGQWLRGPLRPWAEALLDEARLMREGYFHTEPIRKAWIEHQTARRDHAAKLWAVLMFQSWLEANS